MADVRPLAAVRYAAGPDVSDLIAPPYDVLDADDKAAMLGRSPRNVVAVDLPHTPPKALGPDAVYDAAGEAYRAWLADGTLARDAAPALYPYSQVYAADAGNPDGGGTTRHRRGFIGLVRLTPFGHDVIPHELTHAGPIEDRLRLMHATRAQLSPIFGLFDDPAGDVTRLLYRDADPPDVDARLDGVRLHLWTADDPDAIADVQRRMAGKKVYVADGHHRYTTALAYQQQVADANGGALPDDHPANFCLFVLVALQDPGLTIRGYHRLISGLSDDAPDALRAALAPDFDLAETDARPGDPALLAGDGFVAGLHHGVTGRTFRLTPRDPAALDATMRRLAPDHSDAWRSLDSAIVQKAIIGEAMTTRLNAGRPPSVNYTADPARCAAINGDDEQLALLLRPTPLSALVDLGRTGEVMPQKSTYFAPKVATGLAIYPLD